MSQLLHLRNQPLIAEFLQEVDAFIEARIKPLEHADDNIRFFDHRREDARTDWERGGLPNAQWEALLQEAKQRAIAAGIYNYPFPPEFGGRGGGQQQGGGNPNPWGGAGSWEEQGGWGGGYQGGQEGAAAGFGGGYGRGNAAGGGGGGGAMRNQMSNRSAPYNVAGNGRGRHASVVRARPVRGWRA